MAKWLEVTLRVGILPTLLVGGPCRVPGPRTRLASGECSTADVVYHSADL